MLRPRPVPFAFLRGEERLEHVRQNVRRNAATSVADPDFHALLKRELAGGDCDGAAFRSGFRGVQQQVHQHLRQLVRIRADLRQVERNLVLDTPSPRAWAGLEKAQRVRDQAVKSELAQHQGAGARVIHQAAQSSEILWRPRCTARFGALLGIRDFAQLEFEMGEEFPAVGCSFRELLPTPGAPARHTSRTPTVAIGTGASLYSTPVLRRAGGKVPAGPNRVPIHAASPVPSPLRACNPDLGFFVETRSIGQARSPPPQSIPASGASAT